LAHRRNDVGRADGEGVYALSGEGHAKRREHRIGAVNDHGQLVPVIDIGLGPPSAVDR
jgi:hypothetical protein